MVPKTFSFLSLALLLCIFTNAYSTNNPSLESANAIRPALKFSFENCVAFGGGSSADYSEFIAESLVNPECSQLSVMGGHLYRINPNRNQHSCAPGMNGTGAMCISASNFCDYSAGDEKSLRVNVMVEPGPDGIGSLDNIAFFSKAPTRFEFLNGNSGINDYPTKFGIRIMTDAGEIYRSADIQTSQEWAYRHFDLSAVPSASVTVPTMFRIEILPYCPVGLNSNVQAWDIEDLVITGGCNRVNGGVISTASPTTFCSNDGQSHLVDVQTQGTAGQAFSYLLAREDDYIQVVSSSSNFNFDSYPSGNYRIFHIASEGPLTGLFAGSYLYNIGGCYDLSNSISVTNNIVSGGTLYGPSQTSTVTVCPNLNNNVIATSLIGASGSSVQYVLTDGIGQILALYTEPNISLGNLGGGNYQLVAVSYAQISGLNTGTNLSNLSGCYAISSPLAVRYISTPIEGGTVSTAGGNNLVLCDNVNSATILLNGSAGSNSRYIITSAQGRILNITTNPELNFGNLTETSFNIWNIAYENGLTGLEIDGFVSNLQGCFDLSNSISVTRDSVDGGSLSVNGSDLAILCLKNNDRQAVQLDVTGQQGNNVLYLITDEVGEVLQQTQLDNQSSIDFDNSIPGICQIWALVYNGGFSGASAGQNVSTLSGSCFDLSNPVRVIRNEVESGAIAGPSEYDLCLNDVNQRSLALEVNGHLGTYNSWLVTDVDGNVLETLSSGDVDFGSAPAGVCRVYHIAHSDDPILYEGTPNVNDIILGCFELSDPVIVTRRSAQGGALTLENGTTSVTLLLGAGAMATISTNLSGNEGEESIYVIFDDLGNILGIQDSNEFDFSATSPGVCSVVNVSYSGSIGGLVVGERIDFLTGCFSISNRIVVTRENSVPELNAGVIVTGGGMTSASICIGDSSSDSLNVIFTQNPIGPENNYVVTDAQGEILEVLSDPIFNFSGAGAGLCRIYHLVYDEAPLVGLAVGNNINSDLTGNFDLSTPIDVIRNVVSGGSLLTSDSLSMVDVVLNDGMTDVINFISSGNVGDSSLIVLTDTSGEIIGLPTLPLEFDTGEAGTCLVWNLTHATGLTGLQVGQLVPDLVGCYALSNPVTINKTIFVMPDPVDGGEIMTTDSLLKAEICLGSTMESVDVILTGAIGDTSTFVITDTDGMILDLVDNPPIDFGGTPAGVCQIWHINWNGAIGGLTAGENLNALTGNFDLSNAIAVTRNNSEGGSIMTTDSLTAISIVVGDGVIDSIDVILDNAAGTNSAWLVTDVFGEILELPSGPPFVFEGAGAGLCLIWHISYADGLSGLEVGASVPGLQGCYDLSNSIRVTRTEDNTALDGGTIMTSDNLMTAEVCLSSSETEVTVVLAGAEGDNSTYIAADTSGNILLIQDSNVFEFGTMPIGTCEIWHISYNGTITGLAAGENLDDLSGTFDLSNSVLVTRSDPDGGMIMTTDSLTEISIIVGDGVIDSIDVILDNAVGTNSAWIVTDVFGEILELPSGPPFVFEGAGAGLCLIWHISYADGLSGLEVGASVPGLQGCYDLSNSIRVTRTEDNTVLDGGTIMTSDNLMTAEVCLSSSETEVTVVLAGAEGDNSTYIAADTSGNILLIQDSNVFEFGTMPIGTCEIWHISYNGTITGLAAGENLDDLSGTFDLSNSILVTRSDPDGGMIMTTDSLTEISIIVGDGVIDSIDVILDNAVGTNSAWIVTDVFGEILELPSGPPFVFEGAGAGLCLIWHISYADGLSGLEVGASVPGLQGCYDLSNSIRVTRTEQVIPLGVVKFEFGNAATAADSNFCIPLIVTQFDSIDTFSGTVSWDADFLAYTDVQAFGVPGFSATDFSALNASSGVLTYTWIDNSGSNPATLDSLATLFEVCFDYIGAPETSTTVTLVDMPTAITVTKAQADPSNPNSIPLGNLVCPGTITSEMLAIEGGSLMTTDSLLAVQICIGVSSDMVDVILEDASGESSEYILTDTTGLILAVFTNPPFQINTVGVCEIWHISYNGTISGLTVGENIDNLSGSFDLSNSILVTRDDPDGGMIMTTDSLTAISIVVGDGVIDSIGVILDNAVGTNSAWIVTDVFGAILELPSGPPFVFEGAGAGLCLIWHISYADGLSGLEVGASVPGLEGCFDLSNSIRVTRTEDNIALDGGTIMTSDNLMTAEICLASSMTEVTVVLAGAVGGNSSYVVADTSGTILLVQDSNVFQLGTLPSGICEIWHISFNGTLSGLEVGDDLNMLSGTFDFSNEIVVTKDDVDGGLLQYDDNSFAQTIIVGDGVADTLNVILNSNVGDTSNYVLTTPTGLILDLNMGPQFVFPDNTAAGTCRIYNITYSMGLTGLEDGNNINIDLDGCFDLSNFLVLEKEAAVDSSLVAGSIMTADGLTEVDLCTGASGVDLDMVLEDANGTSSSWVVTDTTGIILATPAAEPISLAGGNSETCEIVHIVYDSILTGFTVGEDLDTLSGNFLLSNVVTVNKFQLDANTISLSTGGTEASVVTNDGVADTLVIQSTPISGDTSVFITTDVFGLISAVQDSSTFIFDTQPTGLCLILEVSYNSSFGGIVPGTSVTTLSGCYTLSNSIQVTKTSSAGTTGGVITTPNGNNIPLCLSDSPVDSVFVNLVGGVGDTMTWVITDTSGVILSLPVGGPPFALDTLSAGACQIWHLSFSNPLTGLTEGSNVSDLSGIFDFSNAINVDKNFSSGGDLTTASGMNLDTITLGSDPIDSLFVNLSGSILGDTTSWVVTDTLGNILGLPDGPPFSMESFSPGLCEVWHVAYAEGLTGLQLGNNVETDLSGCYSFSDSIHIVKEAATSSIVNAGIISTLSGSDTIAVCQGNAVIDSSQILIAGQSGPNFNFIVTNSNGFILRVDDTINTVVDTMLVNVEGSPNATSLNLYHIAYEAPLMTLALGQQISTLQGIFDLSNPLVLVNENVNAGSFLPPDSLTIMVGEGIIDTINVTTFGNVVGDTTNWVVYDSLGVITEIDSGPPFTFEETGGGVFHITRLAYIFGLTGLEVGNNLTDLEGCYDMVDPIVVTAVQATLAGGSLMTSDSLTIVDYCFNSTYALDSIEVILADTIGESFAWVVTDTSGTILELPSMPPFLFDDTDPETCFLQNVSYEGVLSGLVVGEDLDTLMGSYLISNSIMINKSVVNGGTLSSPSGETAFEFCVGDGSPDVANFTLADTLGGNYQYIVTDTFNSILLIPTPGNNFVDFEGFGDGVCYVYNLSSTTEILGLTPGMDANSLVGCYELSNAITVTKNGVDGNVVLSTPVAIDNMTSFCVSDGVLDSMALSTNSTMGSYQYVITDENNEIDSVLVGSVIDFEGSDFGTARIYGVSYTGTFTGMPGDTVGIQDLASECYDVSAVPITVVKEDCSMPIITEILGTSKIEIKNIGTAPTDVSSLWLCSDLKYDQIMDLTVDCGSVILQPGDHVVVDLDGNIVISPTDGEMGLYNSSLFGSFDEIIHYTEWGSADHARAGVAIGAGLWLANQFAVPFSATTSLKYDSSGILDTDWSQGAQTPCMDNFGNGGVNRLAYSTYPNPANGIFFLNVPELPGGDGKLIIYDSYGKIVDTKQIEAGIEYKIDLTKYGTGLFFTKVVSGREGVVKKMLIVR